MRVVVVGAGVVGLLTAVECVRAGARVDLVDQVGIPSRLGTSYDVHRVVRTLHRRAPRLTLAAAGLHDDWAAIERRVGAQFYRRTGVLTAMPAGEVDAERTLLHGVGVPTLEVSADELATRYPHVRFGAGDAAVFEPSAGTVLADRALRAIAEWLAAQPGVRLHSHRVVRAITGSAVQFADCTTLGGDGIVVAAGPWSRELLPAPLAAGLTLKRQTMLTYTPAGRRTDWSASPAILGLGPAHDAWLMPPVAGTPARLSAASACRTVPAMTDRATPGEWRDHLVELFAGLLPEFERPAVRDTVEGYYLTDESGEGPLLAELPGPAWVYGACGGLSFKFAPVIARALAERALGRSPGRTGIDELDHPRGLAGVEIGVRP